MADLPASPNLAACRLGPGATGSAACTDLPAGALAHVRRSLHRSRKLGAHDASKSHSQPQITESIPGADRLCHPWDRKRSARSIEAFAALFGVEARPAARICAVTLRDHQ